MSRRIALTGSATIVGAEVLRQSLLRRDIAAIYLLLPVDETVRQRAIGRLEACIGPLPSQVTIMPCDLRLPRFGMSLTSWKVFAGSFDIGIHCAQRDIKDQNLPLARQANLLPVENWIDLLESNQELRLHQLSTAFVGGDRRGLFTEFDLACGQGFHNAWERSLFEAEGRLRDSHVSNRVTIYRPSHILGPTASPEPFNFGAAYPLFGTLAAASVVPGDSHARIDFVPADFVASAMLALIDTEATGTFHLACGWNDSMPVSRAAGLAAECRQRRRAALIVPRALAWPLSFVGTASTAGSRRLAFAVARDFLHQGPVFDTYLADRALAHPGVVRPSPEAWLGAVLRAAEARGWPPAVETDLDEPAPSAGLPEAVVEAASARSNPLFQEKQFHRVGDVDVAYRDIGEGDPVVFLHGLAGAHSWDAVVARIAPRRRALIMETLGLGDTDGTAKGDFGIQAEAARLRGLLSALEITAAHIVGNDIGGVVAQAFAVRWPHCVKSLILSNCDTHGVWPPPHISTAAALMAVPGATLALAALVHVPALAHSRLGLGRLVHDKRVLTPERVRRYVDTVAGDRKRRLRLKRFLRSFDAADVGSVNPLLSQLRAPTMVIWGAEDSCASASWSKTLYEAIPAARRLELIPFTGAACQEERPDLFAAALTSFLDEIGSETSASQQFRFHQSSGTMARTSRA